MLSKYILPNIIVITAYVIGGYAGLLLFTVPTSNAAAIWPASGIALATLLIFGHRVLPGVFIGNFIIEYINFLDTSSVDTFVSSTFLAAIIAFGALCQAWVGKIIINNITKNDEALLKERSILLFAIFAGLISSTISASVAVLSMYCFSILNTTELSLTWFTWWVGDSIGILVFTPLILCFFGRPDYFWKQRINTVALPLFFLVFVSFSIFKISHHHELKYLEEVFETRTFQFTDYLEDSIETHMNTAMALKEFYDSSEAVSYTEFLEYSRPKLSRYPEIRILEWIPVVHHKDREKFEDELDGKIKIPDEHGQMVTSPAKDVYYPIQYLSPYEDNENAFGYDIRNNPNARKAAERACNTGQISATDVIQLVQEKKKLFSVVFYAPVYKQTTPRIINCDNIKGFAASIYEIENDINKINRMFDDNEISVEVESNSKIIYRNINSNNEHQVIFNFNKKYPVSLANQKYEITFSPTNAFFTYYSSWSIWLILVSGVLISGLFGIGLLMLTGRSLRTEEIVKLRTAELNDEIHERIEVEKALKSVAESFALVRGEEFFNKVSLYLTDKLDVDYAFIGELINNDKVKVIGGAYKSDILEPFEYDLKDTPCEDVMGQSLSIIPSQVQTDYPNDVLLKDMNVEGYLGSPIFDNANNPLGIIVLLKEQSITNYKIAESILKIFTDRVSAEIQRMHIDQQLSYQATHDDLTGLVNRREFERRVNRVFDNVIDNEYAICFLDLDQFKVVNDTCGHVAGDELLRQLTTVLEDVVRKRDTLARLGGDEFGVLMEHCSLKDANRVATSILNAIQNYQFIWENKSFKIGVSIGLVPIKESTSNFNELLKDADAACYTAKELGRNRIHVYRADDENIRRHSGEMQWVSHINDALKGDLFCLYAQDIVPLTNSHEIHYELLIRMIDVKGELFPPGAFLPAAERYNLISQIDRWVIKNAFTLLVENPDFLNSISFCSINLSGQTLTSPEILDFIIEALNESDIQGSKICFEITETAAISNLSIAMEFIAKLKDLGCRFALDDFGSGLSSFAYLKNLPVDYLKIDGIFVKDIVDDPIDHAMVKSINEIGQVMGMETIAEFVENDVIKGMLKEIGVNYAQGYGIGKPKPFDQILKSKN